MGRFPITYLTLWIFEVSACRPHNNTIVIPTQNPCENLRFSFFMHGSGRSLLQLIRGRRSLVQSLIGTHQVHLFFLAADLVSGRCSKLKFPTSRHVDLTAPLKSCRCEIMHFLHLRVRERNSLAPAGEGRVEHEVGIRGRHSQTHQLQILQVARPSLCVFMSV